MPIVVVLTAFVSVLVASGRHWGPDFALLIFQRCRPLLDDWLCHLVGQYIEFIWHEPEIKFHACTVLRTTVQHHSMLMPGKHFRGLLLHAYFYAVGSWSEQSHEAS